MFYEITFKDWVTILASMIGTIVIPFSLVGIWRSRIISQEADNWKSRQEEIGTYNDINNRYNDFLKLLLSYPEVNIGEFSPAIISGDEAIRYKQFILFACLIALMERAFLLYNEINKFSRESNLHKINRTLLIKLLDGIERWLFGQHPKTYQVHIFATQWPGWVSYFEHYCGQTGFQEYWTMPANSKLLVTDQWHDTDFEKFIDQLIAKAKKGD